MELERDLRKSFSISDKRRLDEDIILALNIMVLQRLISSTLIDSSYCIRYLSRVGLKRVIKLLQADGNAELLESIILVLLSPVEGKFPVRKNYQMDVENEQFQISDRSDENVCSESGIPVMFDNKMLDEIESLDWLQAFTALNRFDLIIRFFSRELINGIIQILELSKKEGYEELILKYKA